MSLGWIEDVVKDGKVVLQSSDTEKNEELATEAKAEDTVAAPPPPTMSNETAVAA